MPLPGYLRIDSQVLIYFPYNYYDRRRKKRKSSSIRHKKSNKYSSDLSQPISSKAAEAGESAMILDAKEIEHEETDEQFYENTQFICTHGLFSMLGVQNPLVCT
jgi:hypothetical protein